MYLQPVCLKIKEKIKLGDFRHVSCVQDFSVWNLNTSFINFLKETI